MVILGSILIVDGILPMTLTFTLVFVTNQEDSSKERDNINFGSPLC